MGSTPIESEIPLDFSDLMQEAQDALLIYNKLQDTYEYMEGNYTGKDWSLLELLFKIHSIPSESQVYILDLLLFIDSNRIKHLRETKQRKK